MCVFLLVLCITQSARPGATLFSMTALLLLASLLTALVQGLRYDPAFVDYNLNQNQQATNPAEYSASRPGFKYHPSPKDWRFPFYTLFLDRYVNGDPSNDNANGTVFEQDITSNQLRHGGDLQGLIDGLDYIQGMGIKVGCAVVRRGWGHPRLTRAVGNLHCWIALYQLALGCRFLLGEFFGRNSRLSSPIAWTRKLICAAAR